MGIYSSVYLWFSYSLCNHVPFVQDLSVTVLAFTEICVYGIPPYSFPLVCLCFTDCLAHQKVYLRISPVSDLMLKPPAPSTWPGPHDEELSQYLLSKMIIIQGENCFIHSTIIEDGPCPLEAQSLLGNVS